MNKAILLGRLTSDPEFRSTSSGTPTTSFTVAIDRPYKDASGTKQTDFIKCVAWRQQAELVAKYFHKGSRISVVGSIQTRTYDKDGIKHYVTEIIVDEIGFIDQRKESSEDLDI